MWVVSSRVWRPVARSNEASDASTTHAPPKGRETRRGWRTPLRGRRAHRCDRRRASRSAAASGQSRGGVLTPRCPQAVFASSIPIIRTSILVEWRRARSPAAGEAEALAGASARDRLGRRERETHQSLVRETSEGRVHGAHRNLATGTGLDLAADCVAVRRRAELRERQQDVELEFAEKVALGHGSSTNAYFDGGEGLQVCRGCATRHKSVTAKWRA